MTMRSLGVFSISLVISIFVFTASISHAVPFDLYDDVVVNVYLSDRNASGWVELDLGVTFPGLVEFAIDGVDYLSSQTLFYGVGPLGQTNHVRNLVDLRYLEVKQVNDAEVELRFGTADSFFVDVTHRLIGGALGSGRALLNQQFTITNNDPDSSLDFHFMKISDFGLEDNTGQIFNGRRAVLTGEGFGDWEGEDMAVIEKGLAPVPDRFEIEDDYEHLLGGPEEPNLDNTAGPVTDDVVWGFQWDHIISPGGSFTIRPETFIKPVPEPSTLFLFGSGLVGIALMRKKFRS